jgi:hypothetical protein
LIVRSELLVSFIAMTVLVAGSAITMTMMKGITVQTISTVRAYGCSPRAAVFATGI